MGNTISPGCIKPQSSTSSSVETKLFFYDGTARSLEGKRLAAEILFEFPDCMICHADAFFIGQPVPTLAFDEQFINGEAYFVLPFDYFPSTIFSASSLATLGSGRGGGAPPVNFSDHRPFEYVKGSDGRVLIKVRQEFMIKLMTRGKKEINNISGDDHVDASSSSRDDDDDDRGRGHGRGLCSTPELKKHYDYLVGSKYQEWSPKLETISECKLGKYSRWTCVRLEHQHREPKG